MGDTQIFGDVAKRDARQMGIFFHTLTSGLRDNNHSVFADKFFLPLTVSVCKEIARLVQTK